MERASAARLLRRFSKMVSRYGASMASKNARIVSRMWMFSVQSKNPQSRRGWNSRFPRDDKNYHFRRNRLQGLLRNDLMKTECGFARTTGESRVFNLYPRLAAFDSSALVS